MYSFSIFVSSFDSLVHEAVKIQFKQKNMDHCAALIKRLARIVGSV